MCPYCCGWYDESDLNPCARFKVCFMDILSSHVPTVR